MTGPLSGVKRYVDHRPTISKYYNAILAAEQIEECTCINPPQRLNSKQKIVYFCSLPCACNVGHQNCEVSLGAGSQAKVASFFLRNDVVAVSPRCRNDNA